MRFLCKAEDGAQIAYWLIKSDLFSIGLLLYADKSLEHYHSHQFTSINWLIIGRLYEKFFGGATRTLNPSIFPFIIKASSFHKINSLKKSWVFTIRGPKINWKQFPDDTLMVISNERRILV